MQSSCQYVSNSCCPCFFIRDIINKYMEQYPIPQFVEAESRIATFLSFRQFFYLTGAGLICFFLYYIIGYGPLYIFIAFLIFTVAVILAFGKINGDPALNVLLGSIGFSMGGKNYTWQKKESPYPFKPIKRTTIKKIEHGPVLQAQTSQLRKTKMQVELRTK